LIANIFDKSGGSGFGENILDVFYGDILLNIATTRNLAGIVKAGEVKICKELKSYQRQGRKLPGRIGTDLT
jgi:hypothetical protein